MAPKTSVAASWRAAAALAAAVLLIPPTAEAVRLEGIEPHGNYTALAEVAQGTRGDSLFWAGVVLNMVTIPMAVVDFGASTAAVNAALGMAGGVVAFMKIMVRLVDEGADQSVGAYAMDVASGGLAMTGLDGGSVGAVATTMSTAMAPASIAKDVMDELRLDGKRSFLQETQSINFDTFKDLEVMGAWFDMLAAILKGHDVLVRDPRVALKAPFNTMSPGIPCLTCNGESKGLLFFTSLFSATIHALHEASEQLSSEERASMADVVEKFKANYQGDEPIKVEKQVKRLSLQFFAWYQNFLVKLDSTKFTHGHNPIPYMETETLKQVQQSVF